MEGLTQREYFVLNLGKKVIQEGKETQSFAGVTKQTRTDVGIQSSNGLG